MSWEAMKASLLENLDDRLHRRRFRKRSFSERWPGKLICDAYDKSLMSGFDRAIDERLATLDESSGK
jgi:hypothetical protein